jgi:predicted anti-sigma-YlaC factor YlaD
MSQPCKSIAPLLYRVAEGEAAPDEAMLTARHLSDCTACRILLARERRLAAMLDEGLDDPLQVGEDFVQAVMANLPQGPPPAPRGRAARRKRILLKLASLAGLIGAGPLVATAHGSVDLPQTLAWSLRPVFEAPLADGLADGALHLGGLFILVLDRVASGLPAGGEVGLGGALTGLALALAAIVTTASTAGVLAVAVGGLIGKPFSRSA